METEKRGSSPRPSALDPIIARQNLPLAAYDQIQGTEGKGEKVDRRFGDSKKNTVSRLRCASEMRSENQKAELTLFSFLQYSEIPTFLDTALTYPARSRRGEPANCAHKDLAFRFVAN